MIISIKKILKFGIKTFFRIDYKVPIVQLKKYNNQYSVYNANDEPIALFYY